MERLKALAKHSRLLFVALASGAVMLSALGAIGFGPHAISSMALAQSAQPLAKIAELLMRKGYNNVFFGQLCAQFNLAGRVGDRNCRGYQMTSDEGDRRSSFNTYVESGTQAVRIILVNQDSRNGYAFLTRADGELQQAALGSKNGLQWQWSATAVTPELKIIFSKEASFWVESLKDIEALPDRKE